MLFIGRPEVSIEGPDQSSEYLPLFFHWVGVAGANPAFAVEAYPTDSPGPPRRVAPDSDSAGSFTQPG